MIFAIINSYVQFAQAFNCQTQTLKVLNIGYKGFTTCANVINNLFQFNSIRHFFLIEKLYKVQPIIYIDNFQNKIFLFTIYRKT